MSLPTNDADWEIECGTVVRAMQSFVAPYVTPISKVISDDEGRLLGTGSYIEMLGQRLLITNEHNVKALETHSLGLQLHGNDGVFKLHNSAPGLALPVDCAYSLISDHIWSTQAELQPHQARAVPGSRIAIAHMPVENELLFFRGYAGENSKFYFDTLLSTATSYLTRETPLLAGWGKRALSFRASLSADEGDLARPAVHLAGSQGLQWLSGLEHALRRVCDPGHSLEPGRSSGYWHCLGMAAGNSFHSLHSRRISAKLPDDCVGGDAATWRNQRCPIAAASAALGGGGGLQPVPL